MCGLARKVRVDEIRIGKREVEGNVYRFLAIMVIFWLFFLLYRTYTLFTFSLCSYRIGEIVRG